MKKEKGGGKRRLRRAIEEHRKATIIIVIVAVFALAFLGYKLWLNFNFLVKDDLLLVIEPQDQSLNVHYGDKPNVTISAKIENSFACNAFCSYEFSDISSRKVLERGNFTSKGIGKEFSKNFGLSIDRTGTGQKLYSFDIQCNNVRGFYCPSDESKRKRSVFITLNYDISEMERSLKEGLKENITSIGKRLSEVDVEMQNLNNRIFELGFVVNLNETQDDKEILNNEYDRIVLELEALERVWSEENYILLAEMFSKSYDSRLEGISKGISALNSGMQGIVARHNLLIGNADKIDNGLREMNQTVIFLDRADKMLLEAHKGTLNETRAIKTEMDGNTFESYDVIESRINSTREAMEYISEQAKRLFTNSYLEGFYLGALETEKLCIIKGICSPADFPQAIINSGGIDYGKIGNLCASFDSLNEDYAMENNKSGERLKNYEFAKVNSTINAAKESKTMMARKNVFEKIRMINASSGLNESLAFLLQISEANSSIAPVDYGNFAEGEIMDIIELNLSAGSSAYYSQYCTGKTINLTEYYGNKSSVKDAEYPADKNFTSRVEVTLTENYPVCCVFGECKRCCESDECMKDESLYPVLFLHGHAFNSDNSPDFSLDAFNRLQGKLQEEGYVSAGTITPISDYSEIKRGEWGLSSRPITVKGSYYLVSYYDLGSYSLTTQKSENIETYAIRLKELVDLLKLRTGKDKVNIIAHSMGGLVARSYLQIFGDEDVNILILVATPNEGVSGSASSYCPFLGEKKECNDMNENSIFIKKLNDPNKIPESVEIHNIVGDGCDMDGLPGDGIVIRENSKLGHATNYYVNGTCDGISKNLHTEILNIEKYPEVYDIIKSVLEGNND